MTRSDEHQSVSGLDTGGTNELDLHEFYGMSSPQPTLVAVQQDVVATTHLTDYPGLDCDGDTAIQLDFTDYLRFKPAGADSIYVTLGTTKWGVHGTALSTNVPASPPFPDWSPIRPSNPPLDPQHINAGSAYINTNMVDSIEFPKWNKVGHYSQ